LDTASNVASNNANTEQVIGAREFGLKGADIRTAS
jgi:hypothetical protein